MADLASLYDEHKDLSDADAIKAGKAAGGAMGDEHTNFVKLISGMITSGEINPFQPETFFHMDVYNALSEESKQKVDLATINIADQLRHVADFYLSKQTPDASPQLQTMIEQLWQMKERVESVHGDVYKF
jgi:methylaspartate ammonia-lyase